jgi:tRNA modification GTPase
MKLTTMSLLEFKTILAIATPPGYGGIGVIRISGEQSLALTRKLLKEDDDISFTPNQASFHLLTNPETGVTIDEAIITYFRAPHSFTGEDVVELSCHGSPIVLSELIRLITSFGAEPAQPGEFSMRAFLNRRIDLAQAEAINDLIHSQTTYQAKLAARQLRGELSKQLQPIREGLIDLIVHFESTVEFVEDDLDPLNLDLFLKKIDHLIEDLIRLSSSYRLGRVIRSGVKLALIGRPNVGKSSIFNALLGKERAIVTHLPGTTRDTVSEPFSINGIPVNLVDTAGIRDSHDLVEQLGVERTRTAIVEADLVVAVFEANRSLTTEDRHLLDQFPVDLCVINKCDLGMAISEEEIGSLSARDPVLRVSALTGYGIEELKQAIYRQIGGEGQTNIESAIVTNERHYAALEQTTAYLRRAKLDLRAGFTEEIALANLHQALNSLGVITGETLISDIINQIFSTFCIGK